MKFLIVLIFSFFVFSCSAKENNNKTIYLNINLNADTTASNSFKKISSFFRQRYKSNAFNGVALFAEKGRIIYKEALGFSDFRTQEKLQLESKFQLASVSKVFTATAISILEQRNMISYNDLVQKYIPDFPYNGITIAMLLSHRSGLSNYMYFCDKLLSDEEKKKNITNQQVIELMKKYKPRPNYLPDTKYNYCNTNYMLLASIIEIVSGKRYEDFLTVEIFNKIGMKNTVVYNKNNSDKFPSEVVGYKSRKYEAENTYLNGVVGDKGIYSTVDDLFIFDQAMRKGVLVDAKALDSIYFPRHPEIKIKDNYGFGWRIHQKENGGKIVYHGGWWKGFRSYFIRDFDSDKTIIVLKNSNIGGKIGFHKLLNLFDIEKDEEEFPDEPDSLLAD